MDVIKKKPFGYRTAAPGKIFRGRFIERPNRFLVRCEVDGRPVEAFLPNPGRLWELLLDGAELLLNYEGENPLRKTRYTVVAAKREGSTVLLHTHFSNDAAEWLIRNGKIPGLEGWTLKRREVTWGNSRFDFLLEKEGRSLFLESKSCTYFGSRLAMFPDAPSDRGRKHVEELGKLASDGERAAVLFLVQSSRPGYFLPDFHTDPKFAQALYGQRERVEIIPLAVEWDGDLNLTGEPRLLSIPWEVYHRHGGGGGVGLTLLEGEDGGTWLTASQTADLKGFAARATREGGRDFPAPLGGKVRVIPIASALLSEEKINDYLSNLAEREIAKEGKRYFYFSSTPIRNRNFIAMLLGRRTDDLLEGF